MWLVTFGFVTWCQGRYKKTHQPKTRGFFNSYCGVPWGTDMYQCIFPYVYNIVYIYIYIYNYIHYVPYESYMICVPILFLHIHPTFSHENLPFLGGPDLAWRPGLRRWGGDQGLDLLRFSAEN